MLTLHDFEAAIRRAVNYFGIDIHRFRPERIESYRLGQILRRHDIDTVLDVGANIGQFAASLRAAGFEGRIVSFEPLLAVHAKLVQASMSDPFWEVAPRAAIGDRDGEVTINISANSESSSILSMLRSHEQAAPESRFVGSETTPICRLDSIAGGYIPDGTRVMLKIDTQGYESKVLDGAAGILSRIAGIQLELSILELYAGQELMPTLVERMRTSGFELWSLTPNFVDSSTGRMLQFDGIFLR